MRAARRKRDHAAHMVLGPVTRDRRQRRRRTMRSVTRLQLDGRRAIKPRRASTTPAARVSAAQALLGAGYKAAQAHTGGDGKDVHNRIRQIVEGTDQPTL